jgi:hypothetical protein
MSVYFVISEAGNIENQEHQYVRVKKGSNVELTFVLTKDKFRVYPWDLADAEILSFHAKKLKSDEDYVITKDKDSTDWDKTSAETGVLGLVLNAEDLAEIGSLYCEIEFQPEGSDREYKTADMVLDIVASVEDGGE